MGTKDSVKRSTCERDRSMSGRGRVALVRCDSYDSQQVERAVSKAIELLGGLEEILSSGEDPLTKASSIVLKPICWQRQTRIRHVPHILPYLAQLGDF